VAPDNSWQACKWFLSFSASITFFIAVPIVYAPDDLALVFTVREMGAEGGARLVHQVTPKPRVNYVISPSISPITQRTSRLLHYLAENAGTVAR
jgi:hypothetical protein